MDKLLFLDIDGVLNSTQSAHYYMRLKQQAYEEFCPIAVSNLNYIIDKIPDLKIVISSSWRIGKDFEHLKTVLHSLGVNVKPIIDMTPIVFSGDRGHEISMWLEVNVRQGCKMVILDDDNDMGYLQDALIQTDYQVGLSWIEVEKILKFFGNDKKVVNEKSRL